MIWIDSADFDSFLLHDRGERLRKRFVGATILSAVEL
jgi:hypothetical protein